MKLPDSFSFNQANLQDFVDCKYRFYLRYIMKLEWPAIESEPVQEQQTRMELGYRYHQLIQQYFSGIEASVLSAGIPDTNLKVWWENFQDLHISELPGKKYAEKLISVPFIGFRFSAKYDLLLVNELQKATIYDWKTSLYQPRRKTLLDRIQSKVYPFILATTSFPPDNIEMVYWFPAFPDSPVSFKYSSSQFAVDQENLKNLVVEVSTLDQKQFVKTGDERLCKYCRYRSLCDRGETAGELSGYDDPGDWTENPFLIDFDLL